MSELNIRGFDLTGAADMFDTLHNAVTANQRDNNAQVAQLVGYVTNRVLQGDKLEEVLVTLPKDAREEVQMAFLKVFRSSAAIPAARQATHPRVIDHDDPALVAPVTSIPAAVPAPPRMTRPMPVGTTYGSPNPAPRVDPAHTAPRRDTRSSDTRRSSDSGNSRRHGGGFLGYGADRH